MGVLANSEEQRQADLRVLASLVYIEVSRTARAIVRDLVSKKQPTNRKET